MTTASNIAGQPRGATLLALAAALRPRQWTKNVLVLAAFFFAYWDRIQRPSPTAALPAAAAMLLFCLVSSGVYVFNDIRDLEADRRHPEKRYRPIASGRLGLRSAWVLAGCLLAVGLAGAWLLGRGFAAVVGAYAVMQVLYTLALKRVALLDVFVIAAGFVLRAVAGAVAVRVAISPWLLLCTFLLSLFLALCKRRHEKLIDESGNGGHRPSLAGYDARLLDQLIAIAGGATIVSYAIYTLSQQTVEKFGTHSLGLTIPFVVFGIFRYLDLAYRLERGGRPEKILLTDGPILATVALYGATVVLILKLGI